MKKVNILVCLLGLFSFTLVHAQEDTISSKKTLKDYSRGIINAASVGIEYRVKAGIALGGTTPLPLPEEIRSIEGFKPGFNTLLEGEIEKSFTDSWSLLFGLRLETKGMETDAKVKNYHITMVSGGETISGMFTGSVTTKVRNSYLTLPVLAMWKPAERWGVKFGPYCSYALSREFSGEAADGYLREGNPTGDFIEIDNATYEFSSDLRRWNFGLQLGGEWQVYSHLLVSIDLTWGMTSIFPKDFDVITFEMYPVFASLSFGYVF